MRLRGQSGALPGTLRRNTSRPASAIVMPLRSSSET
jgi:hypothetical protein